MFSWLSAGHKTHCGWHSKYLIWGVRTLYAPTSVMHFVEKQKVNKCTESLGMRNEARMHITDGTSYRTYIYACLPRTATYICFIAASWMQVGEFSRWYGSRAAVIRVYVLSIANMKSLNNQHNMPFVTNNWYISCLLSNNMFTKFLNPFVLFLFLSRRP